MKGQIVCSKAGRDKGYFMVVVGVEDGYVLVCDGKERPLERPKRKNVKHIKTTRSFVTEDDCKSNKHLRKALAVFKDFAKIKEEL